MPESIEALAEEFACGLRGSEWLSNLAKRTGGLPVYASWWGEMLLLPDGNVIFIDDDGEVSRVLDRATIRLVHKRASEIFPQLAGLAPQRPPDVPDCATCRGTGKSGTSAGCRACGSMGWLA